MTEYVGTDNAADKWWRLNDGQLSWGDTAQEAEGRERRMSEADAELKYGPFIDRSSS